MRDEIEELRLVAEGKGSKLKVCFYKGVSESNNESHMLFEHVPSL